MAPEDFVELLISDGKDSVGWVVLNDDDFRTHAAHDSGTPDLANDIKVQQQAPENLSCSTQNMWHQEGAFPKPQAAHRQRQQQ